MLLQIPAEKQASYWLFSYLPPS